MMTIECLFPATVVDMIVLATACPLDFPRGSSALPMRLQLAAVQLHYVSCGLNKGQDEYQESPSRQAETMGGLDQR